MRFGSENIGNKKYELIHKISRIIGNNAIRIRVIGTQEKKVPLGLYGATKVRSIKTLYKIKLIYINKIHLCRPPRH